MDNSFAYQPATERYERMQYKYCGRSGLLSITVLLISIWQITTVLFPEVPKQTSGGF